MAQLKRLALSFILSLAACPFTIAPYPGKSSPIFRDAAAKNHWLQVRLQGAGDNRQGIGARVAVLRKNQTPLWRQAHTDGSYLSSHDSRVHFGLGSDPTLQGVLVHWPGGTREVFEGIKPDTIVTLKQQTGKPYKEK